MNKNKHLCNDCPIGDDECESLTEMDEVGNVVKCDRSDPRCKGMANEKTYTQPE
jgi:hypothetical protein